MELFAAVGALFGVRLVPPTFLVALVVGGCLALLTMIRTRSVVSTTAGVFRIIAGLLPGRRVPKFTVPADRVPTVPYGVAIVLGSIISPAVFTA